MNKARRQSLAKAAELLREALEIIEAARDEEHEAFDNLPEGLQAGERGEAMQEAADALDTIHGEADTAIDELTDLVEG